MFCLSHCISAPWWNGDLSKINCLSLNACWDRLQTPTPSACDPEEDEAGIKVGWNPTLWKHFYDLPSGSYRQQCAEHHSYIFPLLRQKNKNIKQGFKMYVGRPVEVDPPPQCKLKYMLQGKYQLSIRKSKWFPEIKPYILDREGLLCSIIWDVIYSVRIVLLFSLHSKTFYLLMRDWNDQQWSHLWLM